MWPAGRVSSRSGFEYHAEGHLRGVAEIAEPAGGDDFAKARLAGLGAERGARLLRQRGRYAPIVKSV
jgi:hypothetical protein